MNPSLFSQLGIHPATKTPLFISELPSFADFNPAEFPMNPLTLFIAADSSKVSAAEISDIAEKLLQRGLRYVCTWGPDCERVHDIFDETIVGDGSETYNFQPMTTWHDEPFGEALYFFLSSAHVEDKIANAASFAVRIGDPPNSLPLTEAIQRIEEFQSD